MFNYKRLTFIFILISFLLVVTDSSAEKQARKGLLSLINVVVVEGSEVSETAPSSLVDTFENGRISLYNFLNRQTNNFSDKGDSAKGVLAVVYVVLEYIFLLLKFIAGYVITFYPFIVFLFYSFFTSRFFKRDEFYYGDY